MEYNIFFSNILVHVGILAVFLTIFFFTIAVTVEKDILEKQIEFIVDVLVGNIFKGIGNDQKIELKNIIDNSLNSSDFEPLDKQTEKSNQKIIQESFKFLGILIFIVLLILIVLGYIYKWGWIHIKLLIFGAILSLIFVGVTESSFLLLIASNYLSADPNNIRRKIVDELFNSRK